MAKILVIDDEASILRTFEIFLAEEGHEVLTARSYDDAIAHLSRRDVDVVFSDIILQGRSGIDILREVRRQNLSCLVIMITAYPGFDTASEAVRLGAFDYVVKPVVQETLLRLTAKALQFKKALDERENFRTHLEAIFRSVGDAIVTVDRELRVSEFNEAAKNLLGVDETAIGSMLSIREMPCKERILESLAETIDGKETVRARRVECRREGLPSIVLSVSASRLTDLAGHVIGAVLVLRDETRLAGLEHNLEERRQLHRIVGKSKVIRNVYQLIESLADVDTTVLITGESGTGKELVAEALHFLGARTLKPLVKVNCSSIPESLLESELFGHVKGAFTGAATDRIGRFERADGGTILLDEIGDVSNRLQLSLLRVLQEKEFERVGDSRPRRVDVRVIASTNRDLAAMMQRGAFREDLYYRLKVLEISLPPLRKRREDIPLLIEHLLSKLNRKLGREIQGVSSDVEELCMNYQWPGNVRELEHAMEHACILCRGDTICMDQLPPELQGARAHPSALLSRGTAQDAEAVRGALGKTGGNVSKAARLLGIDRKTVYRKIARYGMRGEPPS